MLIGDRLKTSVDPYTGAAAFSLDLVTLPGRNGVGISLQLSYFGRVERAASIWNLEAPTGLLGLGWSLSLPRIVSVPAGVAAHAGTTYFLVGGGGVNRLLQTGTQGTLLTFVPENWLPWKITYDPASERWDVLDEDGTRSVYGDTSAGVTRSTVQWSVGWGNWIDSSSELSGQQRAVSVWNLSEVSNRFGDRTLWTYESVDVAVSGATGLTFTTASYPTKVTAPTGDYVVFRYGQKDPSEYQLAHTAPSPPNAWQDRLETRYLAGIDVYAANGSLVSTEEPFYGAPAFLGGGALTKRLLLGLRKLRTGGSALPGVRFAYWGQDSGDGVSPTSPYNAANGALYGAMKTATLPEGGTYSWEYKSVTPALSSRSLPVSRPVVAGVTFSQPRFTFAGAYAVVTWFGTATQPILATQAFTWDGRWIPSPLLTINVADAAMYDAARLAVAESVFAIDVNQQLHLYALDAGKLGQWVHGSYSPSFDAGEATSLVCGAGFAAIVGVSTGKLYRYRFTGTAWQDDPLVTLQAGGTGGTFAVSAARNVLAASGIRAGAAGAPLYLTLDRRLGTGGWAGQTVFQTAPSLAPVDAVALFAGDTFVVYRGTQTVGTQKTYRFGAAVWNAALSSIAEEAWDTLVLDSSAPAPEPVLDRSLVAVGQSTHRFDGVRWVAFDVATVTYPQQQAVEAVSIAADLVVRRVRTAAAQPYVYDLVAYDPNTGAWSNPAAVVMPSSDGNLPAAAPRLRDGAASGFAVLAGGLRYRLWTGVWSDTGVTLPGIASAADAATVQLLGDFAVYQVQTGQAGVGTRVFFLKNGSTTSPAPLPLAGEQIAIPGQPMSALVGTTSFVSYTGTFGTNTSVMTLHRVVGEGCAGAQTAYAVKRLVGRNGYPAGAVPSDFPTGFAYDETVATIAPNGLLPQFNLATVLPGDDEPTFGSKVTAFFNGLTPDVPPPIAYPVDAAFANAQTLYSLAKGLVYAAQNRAAVSAEAISSLVRYQWITVLAAAQGGAAFYPRTRRVLDTLDGVTTTTDNEFAADTGLLTATTRDNVDADGRLQYFRREMTLIAHVYPQTAALNLLTPVVQVITRTRMPGLQPATDEVTSNRVVTWKSDWGSGGGQWAPCKVFAARSANAPAFTAWGPTDPDPAGWLRVAVTLARGGHGEATRISDAAGIVTSLLWSKDASRNVAIAANADAALDEAAYFGCEPYELPNGWTWSDPQHPIWSFVTTDDFHTGTQSIRLPAAGAGQKVGPTRVFAPGGQHRRFLFSAWTKRANGFVDAQGKAYVEIAVFDVTSSQWLTPVVMEMTGAPGAWAYLQTVIDLDALRGNRPATDVLSLHVTAYDQNSTTVCYVDELRFSPLDGAFRGTVYDPTRLDVTSVLAQNGQSITTLYDRHARPVGSIGPLERVNALVSGSFSRSLTAADAFLPSYPNSTLTLATSSFSRYYDFHDGNTADWDFAGGGTWAIANGELSHAGASPGGLGATAQLKIVASRNFAARVLVRPGVTAPASIALGNNDVFLRYTAGTWQLVKLAGTAVTVLAASPLSGFRQEWIFVCVDGFVLAYADGVQVFGYTYSYPPIPPAGWGKVTIAVDGDCAFDDLVVLQEPQLSLAFSDGLGQPMQAIALQGKAIAGVYANAYPVASSGVFYDALGRPQYDRITLAAPLQIASPAAPVGNDPAAQLVLANESTYLRDDSGQALSVSQFLSGVGGYGFTQLTYETSPLSRAVLQTPPRAETSDLAASSLRLVYTSAQSATEWLPFQPGSVPAGAFFSENGLYLQTLGSQASSIRYTRVCDRNGNVVSAMQGPADGLPNIYGFFYDSGGRLTKLRQPNYYNPPGGTSPADWVETRAYDFLGPLTKVTTPDSGATEHLYDDVGRLRFTVDAVGNALSPQRIQYQRYDGLSRVVETGFLADARYGWKSANLLAKLDDQGFPITDPAQSSNPDYAAGEWRKRFTFDALADPRQLYLAGALARVEMNSGDPANPDRQDLTYDAFGNVVALASAVRQFDTQKTWTFRYDYDNQDHIRLITYPVMDVNDPPFKVGYTYDRLGRLAAIGDDIDPGGIVDPNNPPIPPEKRYSDLSYSPNGYLAQEVLNSAPQKPSLTRTYGYTAGGALSSISDPFSTEGLAWDSGSVVSQPSDYFSGLIGSTTDAYHSARWTQPPSDYRYDYGYGATGQLRSARSTAGATSSITVGAPGHDAYDANGNILVTARDITLTQYAYAPQGGSRTNRLASTTSSASDQMDFDGVAPDATGARGWSWGSNNGGPSTSFLDTSQPHSGTQSLHLGGGSLGHYERLWFEAYLPPDGTLVLTCWVRTGTGFDAAPGEAAWYLSLSGPAGAVVSVPLGDVPANAGSWTRMSVSRDIAALRRQLGIGLEVDYARVELRNAKLGASASGPYLLVDDVSLSATAIGTLGYDLDGRMTQASSRQVLSVAYDPVSSLPRSIQTGGTLPATLELTYDSGDRRSLERVTTSSGTAKTLLLRGLTGSPLVSRSVAADGTTVTTYFVLGPDGIVAFKRGQPIAFVLKDHLGSTRVVVDGDSGTPVDAIDFLPFGDVLRRSGSPPIDALFTGQQLDATTGLYNYNARLYDPTLGRFLQPDSAGQFPSPYSYVGTEPIGRTDPTGRNAIVVLRSTKSQGFLDTPDTGHAGVLVEEPDNPGLWIYRDIIPTGTHKPYACSESTKYNVYWFEVYGFRANETEPNYPSGPLRQHQDELCFRTKSDLADHLANRFPRFSRRPDAVLEIQLTPQQDRALIDAYEYHVERGTTYCTLGHNCVGFVESGLEAIGFPSSPKEGLATPLAWLFAPFTPLLGGYPGAELKAPNSFYRTIAASGYNVTYHKALGPTAQTTITSATLQSNLVAVPLLEAGLAGLATYYRRALFGFGIRTVAFLASAAAAVPLAIGRSLAASPAALVGLGLLLLPQPVGESRENPEAPPFPVPGAGPSMPGFLIGGDPEKNVVFADLVGNARHVVSLTYGMLDAPPAIFNGYAYAGEGNTTGTSALHAWSLADGSDAWSGVTIPASVDASPVIHAAVLYVAAANGFLYAYDIGSIATPRSLWQLDVMHLAGGTTVKTASLVLSAAGNEVYLLSAAGIFCVDLVTHTVLWRSAETSSFVQAAPLLLDTLLVASSGSSVYAYDTTAAPDGSGHLASLWSYAAPAACGAPVRFAASIGVLDAGGGFHALNSGSGAQTASVSGVVPPSAALQSTFIQDIVVAVNPWGNLYARRIATAGGQLAVVRLWDATAAAPVASAPLIQSGIAYVAAMGKLRGYRLVDGFQVWSADTPSAISRIGQLGVGLRVGASSASALFLLDGAEFFLRLRNLLLAAGAGTFSASTPAKSPTFAELMTAVGKTGPSYTMLWDTTTPNRLVRSFPLAGELLDWIGKPDYRANFKAVRDLDGKPNVQAILTHYQEPGTTLPMGSQHQKIAVVSVGGTKLALVAGFNVELPNYWDEPDHPMKGVSPDGRKNYATWHDTAVLLQGSAADLVEAQFDRIWERSRNPIPAPGPTFAKVAFWAADGGSCLDKYTACSGTDSPTPYADPRIGTAPIGVDVLVTDAQFWWPVRQVRDRLVQRIAAATQYVYFENYAFNDILLVRALVDKLKSAPAGFLAILMTPHPTRDDDGKEQVGENRLSKMAYAAIWLATQQPWTSFTLASGEVVLKSAISNLDVRFDDRGPEWTVIAFRDGSGPRQVSPAAIVDFVVPSTPQPTLILCSPARYLSPSEVQPGDEKYELTGGLLSKYFRKIYVHSKLALFDDAAAVIGSANFTERSMAHDGEVSACVYDGPTVIGIRQRLFTHWGMNTIGDWVARMQAFAATTTPSIGVLPLTFKALPNDWPEWWWSWMVTVVDPSDIL